MRFPSKTSPDLIEEVIARLSSVLTAFKSTIGPAIQDLNRFREELEAIDLRQSAEPAFDTIKTVTGILENLNLSLVPGGAAAALRSKLDALADIDLSPIRETLTRKLNAALPHDAFHDLAGKYRSPQRKDGGLRSRRVARRAAAAVRTTPQRAAPVRSGGGAGARLSAARSHKGHAGERVTGTIACAAGAVLRRRGPCDGRARAIPIVVACDRSVSGADGALRKAQHRPRAGQSGTAVRTVDGEGTLGTAARGEGLRRRRRLEIVSGRHRRNPRNRRNSAS